MTPNGNQHYFKFLLSGILTKLALLTELVLVAGNGDRVQAQIIPDDSLGAEASIVTPNVEIKGELSDRIDGGALRDSNLFHSFEQFNIADLQRVYFANPEGIINIFSRVTGNNLSEIFGTLGVNGNANLFLINPNGIIFGENASLDVGGSFVGSTANGIAFENGFSFSSASPEAVPLLRINVPVGLQYGANPGRIIVQGNGQGLRATTDLIDTLTGLRVPPNQTLALVGGEMELSEGTLKTAGGRIELGSVTQSGLVTLTPIAQGWALGYDGIKNFGDIKLSQQAAVDASGKGGGDIQVRGRRVSLSDGSQIESTTLGSEAGGNLTVNVTESVQVIGESANGEFPSGLFASTLGTGDAGNLEISTPTLLISDGAQVTTASLATGAGGNLTVNATESVQVIGESANGQISGLSAQANRDSTGNAGDLSISTSTLLIADGAFVSADTFASGAGGNLTVNATKSVQVIGTSADGQISGLSAQTNPGSIGNAGDLSISTPTLLISDGGLVSTGTFGKGAGGNLTVNATESVQLFGRSADGEFSSSLSAQAEPGSTGNAGDLTINTPTLLIADGAQVSASTVASGAGGDLIVNATESVQVIGESADGEAGSNLSAQASKGTGNAGDLTIRTPTLLIQDGGFVSASTFASGTGGDLIVNATESVQLFGRSADGRFPSGLFAQANRGSTGNAGNLTISTPTLLIQDGATVSAGTFAEGAGGNLTVDASSSVQLIGTSADGQFPSLLNARTISTGDAGSIKITTGELLIFDGAEASVSSTGEGRAGNLELTADSVRLDQGSTMSTTFSGDGGNLTLNVAELLLLRRGSQISTTAGTAQAGGDGGNITINTPDGFIVAFPQENSDIKADAFEGKGGNIQIDTENIFGFELQENPNLSDITASSQFGLDGTVNINTSGIEPGQELIELPIEIVDVSQLIDRNLCLAGQEGEFIITGKGGLSPSPQDTLNIDAGWEDWRMAENNESNHQQSSQRQSIPEANNYDPNRVIEAQSWFIAPNGNIVLSARPVKSVSRNSSFPTFNCQSLDRLQP